MIKKILVTGGAGYIGSILVPRLLSVGYEVVVIDNFMYGQTSLLDVCHDKRLTVYRGDVRDKAMIKSHINDVDMIIPLACIVGAPACNQDPSAALAINLEAIITILELRSQDQKILFPNTNSGYGRMEVGVAHCDETSPLYPVSLYGQLKVEAERKLIDAGNVIVFRLATVFGMSPRMRLDLLVNDFVYRAVNDACVVLFEPHFKRNYIHVCDVARVFLYGVEHFDRMQNEIYNVGLSSANLSKFELCQEIKKQIPNFVFMEALIGEDPDKRDYIVSNAKIEDAGFRPCFSLADGIEELAKGYQILKRNGFTNV